ncbi:MAG: hypothetical protein JXX14_19540 [Deltaproteobacteria bacterium]|nr:hypothetical protein [Deltaproteobacteria bacterium]
MKNHLFRLLFPFAVFAFLACSDKSSGDDDGGNPEITSGFGSGAQGDVTVGDEGGDESLVGGIGDASGEIVSGGNDGDFVACESISSDVSQVETRVMLLEDKSRSMNENNKWSLSIDAITEMVTNYDSEISFGLDLFSRATSNDGEMCTVGNSVVHDVAPNNGGTIINELSRWEPSAATPLLLAMRNYTSAAYAPVFLNGSAGSYLVIISDGMDTCSADGQFRQDVGASAAELAAVTTQLLNEHGIRTIVIGFGQGIDPAQLNAIAAAGGTVFSTYLQADDGEQLKAALAQIAETVVVSCEFQVGTFQNPDIDYDWVLVYLDGQQIARDDDCKNGDGWTWTSAAHTTIRFCSRQCTSLEAGEIGNIGVRLACSEDEIIIVE